MIVVRQGFSRPLDVRLRVVLASVRLFRRSGVALSPRDGLFEIFLPSLPTDRAMKGGNAALRRVSELLLPISPQVRLEEFLQQIEHVELESVYDLLSFSRRAAIPIQIQRS